MTFLARSWVLPFRDVGSHASDNVLFGPRVGIFTRNHATNPVERANGACYAKPVVIGDNVWVGGNVSINQGVTIGNNSIIGSGSVITKNIPANTIAAGVPARALRTRRHHAQY